MAVVPASSRASSTSTGGMSLISSSVLASPGTFSFTSVPATYTDLYISGVFRSSNAVALEQVQVQFNADSSAHYIYQRQLATGATSSAGDTASASFLKIGSCPAANDTTDRAGQVTATICGYTSTVFDKQVTAVSSNALALTTGNVELEIMSGAWIIASPAAITRVDVFPGNSANFIVGCRCNLWGVS